MGFLDGAEETWNENTPDAGDVEETWNENTPDLDASGTNDTDSGSSPRQSMYSSTARGSGGNQTS